MNKIARTEEDILSCHLSALYQHRCALAQAREQQKNPIADKSVMEKSKVVADTAKADNLKLWDAITNI